MTPIIFAWILFKIVSLFETEVKSKSKLYSYDMPDDLFLSGAYCVGDEFKL